MTSPSLFISDFAETFQEAWKWYLEDIAKPDAKPRYWKKRDWERLVDLYTLSKIADAKKFDALSHQLQSQQCVPDQKTLVEIGKWKARGRITRLLEQNDDENVREVSKRAIGLVRNVPSEKRVERSTEAIELFQRERLHGMKIPMASTVLAMYNPVNFPVIDRLAYSLLFDHPDKTEISYSDWKRYFAEVQELAKCHGLRCRDIDAALWFVGSFKAEEKRLQKIV